MRAFVEFFENLFVSDFMPHGSCYFWQPGILWLNAISDGLITVAYYSIPLTLFFFVKKRVNARYRGLVLMFSRVSFWLAEPRIFSSSGICGIPPIGWRG